MRAAVTYDVVSEFEAGGETYRVLFDVTREPDEDTNRYELCPQYPLDIQRLSDGEWVSWDESEDDAHFTVELAAEDEAHRFVREDVE